MKGNKCPPVFCPNIPGDDIFDAYTLLMELKALKEKGWPAKRCHCAVSGTAHFQG